MAIDVYLKIETPNLEGESDDKDHKKQIECLSVSFGVDQPKSATASTAGGHTAERCNMQDIAIAKYVDLASPLLMKYCSSGQIFKKATLEFMRANADGKRVKYYTVTLENVLISSVNASISEGDVMREQVTLRAAKHKWDYTQLKIDGTVGGNKSGGYDLATNTVS